MQIQSSKEHNAGERLGSEPIYLAIACHYLDPRAVAAKLSALFQNWTNLRIKIYTTNDKHRHLVGSNSRTPGEIVARYVGNQFNDFTAYMSAVSELTAEIENGSKSSFIFLNDTLFLKHPASALIALFKDCIPTIGNCSLPLICGRTHAYRVLMQTSPFSPGLDRYVSTFMFGTNFSGLKLLQSTFAHCDTFIASLDLDKNVLEKIPSKLAETLRLHLELGTSVNSWKGRRDRDVIRRKAIAVLLEQLISSRFYEEGLILPIAYTTAREWRLNIAYVLFRTLHGRRAINIVRAK